MTRSPHPRSDQRRGDITLELIPLFILTPDPEFISLPGGCFSLPIPNGRRRRPKFGCVTDKKHSILRNIDMFQFYSKLVDHSLHTIQEFGSDVRNLDNKICVWLIDCLQIQHSYGRGI